MSVFLNICSDNVLVSAICHGMNSIAFPASCWIDIASRTFWTVVGYFLMMLSIHTLFLFLELKPRFQGLLFFEWYI